jgi:eukaryotic-like serine/threonine-protein kinase
MPQPQPVDRQTFLANIRQSGLLSEEQLSAIADRLPDTTRAKLVARALVEEGLLTRYQAERLLVGRQTLFTINQYRILDKLGRGGMGHVYKAEQRIMNRVVALKVLAPNLMQTDRAQDLFRREMQLVARLVHPNIVTAYDANHVGGRYYLVLEYVNGPNLDQMVRKQGPLPIGQACEYLRQVANGLQYAHEQGMVHRDIKPANILIQQTGEGKTAQAVVKISDFGLARLQESSAPGDEGMGTILTKENTVMGTPDFLSPEQARSLHKVDIRSDLYSLGCTFYFLLTGKVPFPGGATLEKLIRHSTEAPTPAEQLRPDIPAGVAAILNRLLEKNPDDRYQTPDQLGPALVPFASKDPAQWATALPASTPFLDDLATLDDGGRSAADLADELERSDEASAMAGTLPADFSPTPVSTRVVRSASRLSKLIEKQQRRRATVAILVATGVVAGLVALLSLVGFIASRM